MQIVQRLLGRVAEQPVGVALEGSQVVERGRLFGLFFPLHGADGCHLVLAGGGNGLGFRLCFQFVAGSGKIAAVKVDRVKRLRLKRGNLRFPLHDKRQRRGHYAPDVQCAVVEDGKQARCVDAHQPVGLGATERGLMQVVVIPARFQIGKALTDGLVLH
ncbi:hypothetical protein SDC9_94867 [bioreactor metagenome]|uniref:Uncharacterized protein n=1 Tax=bioreactor metagenome TaxID=1076179 RepID=A0A645AEP5_9ZZZZ